MKSSRVDIWRSLLYTLPTWLWIYAVLAHIAERCKIHVICTILLGCLCSVVKAVFNSGGHYTSQVWTFVQRSLFLSSLATGVFISASRANVTFFRCIGREELFRCRCGNLKGFGNIFFFFFRYNLSNFYTTAVKFRGVEFQGAFWDPTRLLPNIVNFSFVIIVPALYGSIFRFRRKHTATTLGGYRL